MPIAAKPEFMASYAQAKECFTDPSIGIDNPELLVRVMVLSAMNEYRIRYGRPPNRLSIPLALEAALEVDRGRNLEQPKSKFGKLRESETLFGCPVVWDAREFSVT